MGEYADYQGRSIKIGTCENMYYLRADQVKLIAGYPGLTRDKADIRFRFPWPDEDHIEPGYFDDFDRSLTVPGITSPADVTHYTAQFKAEGGFLVSLPCPEWADAGVLSVTVDGSDHAYRVHRNGFTGGAALVQQRYWDGLLVAVMKCGTCGARWRLETWADAEPLVVALRSHADMSAEDRANFWHIVADRVTEGYGVIADTEPETQPA